MTNSKKRCKHCKEYKPVETMFKTPKGTYCNIEHAMEEARILTDRDIKRALAKQKTKVNKAAKAERKKHKADKESIKKLSEFIKEAQVPVNKYIRLRDAGRPCISCGNISPQKRGGTMEAGHYRSRGAASHLRFNVFNIHLQCVKCNRFNSGNAVDYRIRLIQKIGLDRVERLENDNGTRKFTIDYCKRVKKIFSKRARRLEKKLDI